MDTKPISKERLLSGTQIGGDSLSKVILEENRTLMALYAAIKDQSVRNAILDMVRTTAVSRDRI